MPPPYCRVSPASSSSTWMSTASRLNDTFRDRLLCANLGTSPYACGVEMRCLSSRAIPRLITHAGKHCAPKQLMI